MAAPAYSERLRPIRIPAYSFLAITLLFQVADFALGVMPFHLEQLVWRFATIGSLANNIGNILLLIFLLKVAAITYRDRPALLAIGVITAVGAVFLLLCTASFTLDIIQLSGKVQAAATTRFLATSGEALVKCIVESVLFAMISASAFRIWRADSPSSTARTSDDLLIGRGTASRPI